MYSGPRGELVYVCAQCGCGSVDQCWNCGSTDIEVHLAVLHPGVLVTDILEEVT